MNRIIKRMAAPIGAALIIGTSGFAFMASNDVPVTHAGEGSNGIAGFKVSNVHYDFGFRGGPGANSIAGVSFDLDQPARTVDAFLTGSNGDGLTEFRDCTTTNGGYSWKCGPDATNGSSPNRLMLLSQASGLTVAAAQ